MKNKFDKLRKSMELPVGVISGFYIEIYSGKEIVLNGDAAVTEIDDSVLKVKCGEHHIAFRGKKIEIENYTSAGIKITGDFSAVEFK